MAKSLKKLQSFFLLPFTIASIASDMTRHMNGFAILDTIIFRNAIELAAITILCHSHCYPSRGSLIGCMFQAAVIQKLTQHVFILNILQEVYYNLNTLNHTPLIH